MRNPRRKAPSRETPALVDDGESLGPDGESPRLGELAVPDTRPPDHVHVRLHGPAAGAVEAEHQEESGAEKTGSGHR
jgi:hypothetical protein